MSESEPSLKRTRRSLALFWSALLLASTALRAQSALPHRWFDAQGAIAYESNDGNESPANATTIDLTLRGSFRTEGNRALQFAGDYFSNLGQKVDCGVNPFNGGCITDVRSIYTQAIGIVAAYALFSDDGRMPLWTASLGAGPYWLGRSGQTLALGLRAAFDRQIAGGTNAGLTVNGSALVLPMGPSAPISLFSLGLGLRVW